MQQGLFMRVLICILFIGLCIYSYIDKQNELTALRIRLPVIAKEIKKISEENTRLQYEIDQFENPQHLMQLLRHSEFCHLKHPLSKEVLTLREGKPLQLPSEEAERIIQVKPKLTVAIGAQH